MIHWSCLGPYWDFEIESFAKRIIILIVFSSCLVYLSDGKTPRMASFQVNSSRLEKRYWILFSTRLQILLRFEQKKKKWSIVSRASQDSQFSDGLIFILDKIIAVGKIFTKIFHCKTCNLLSMVQLNGICQTSFGKSFPIFLAQYNSLFGVSFQS